MKNIKIEKNLVGDAWWRGAAMIEIKGDPSAAAFPSNVSAEEKEKIIQSWKTVAVFKITKNIPFYIGFQSDNYIGFLKSLIETEDGKFGMRIGRDNVKFFAFDPKFENDLQLELSEITTEDNPSYLNLPLY